jgi:heme-degrading monooxygenase HmoA
MATSAFRSDKQEVAVFAVTRLRAWDDGQELAAAVAELLAALARRPGFRDGELGRSADDPSLWALVTRWDGVGAYRRALSAAEVKIAGAPVWVHALDEPGAYLPQDDVAFGGRDA